jgi:hypothetical protein
MPSKWKQSRILSASPSEAAKNLVMQFRIERWARWIQYIGLALLILFVVAAVLASIYPVHLDWRDGPAAS